MSYKKMQNVKILNDLAFQHNYLRLKAEFREYPSTGHDEYLRMNRELSFAYWELSVNKNARAALAHLDNVEAICEERLSPNYLYMYQLSRTELRDHIEKHGDLVHVATDLQKMLSRMKSL